MPGAEETQFIPLNDVEAQLWAATRSSADAAMRILLTAKVWLPDSPLLPRHPGPVDALHSYLAGRTGHIELTTAPQRFIGRPSGPWSFHDVASGWPAAAAMVVNPGTPIRVELTADEVRILVRPRAQRTVDPAAEGIRSATGQGSTLRGQRFARRLLRRGYDTKQVDAFAERIEATLAHHQHGTMPSLSPVTAREVHDVVFQVRFNGYDEWQVDLWLDRMERAIDDAER